LLVVLGLGNPGDAYRGTRHNLGKEIVSSLTEELGLRARPGKGDYNYARDNSRDLLLVVPTIYMNINGRAAAQALEHFGALVTDLVAVCDDFALPLGSLRIRRQGSDGGHNGLASIIGDLGSQDFSRLRVGVGPVPAGALWTDFVLSRFERSEEAQVAEAVSTAREAVLAIAAVGVERAQNLYNARCSPDEAPGPGEKDPGESDRGGDPGGQAEGPSRLDRGGA
jgi:PTH1 family peptidyl-tRNA hydrolase